MLDIGETDMRDSKLKDAINTLEQDVQNYTMNSKQIAADCADVLKHLANTSKMHGQQ